MVALGIGALVVAIVLRAFAGLARLVCYLLLIAGLAFVVLGLLGFELPTVLHSLRGAIGLLWSRFDG